MERNILQENHISLTSAVEISNICRPLQRYFNVSHFSYLKVYNDHSRIHLCTNADWLEFFHNKYLEYEGKDGLTEIHCRSLVGHNTWDSLRDKQVQSDMRNYFNTSNGIVIVNSCSEHVELSFFGSTIDNRQAVPLLLGNIDLLQQFIIFFKQQAESLITQSDKHRIVLKPFFKGNTESPRMLDLMIRKAFLEAIYHKKEGIKYLSNREIECIYFSARGNTAKEVAKILGISFKTVEKHIASAKAKLDCKRKTALINKMYTLEKSFNYP